MKSTDDASNVSTKTSNPTQPITWAEEPSHTGMKYGYNTISIPYDMSLLATSFTTNFEDDVYPVGNSTVYMYTWAPSGIDVGGVWQGKWETVNRANAVSTKSNGTGFYFYSRGYTNVIDVDSTESGDLNTDNWTGIPLSEGRNLIGNPYLKDVNFSDIKICTDGTVLADGTCSGGTLSTFASNANMDGSIVHFNNNTSTDAETCDGGSCNAILRPWWGHWVYVLNSSATYSLAVPEPAP